MRFYFFFILVLCISWSKGFSQGNDPVLFSIEDTPVKISEFNYIYNKNNGKNADYSKKSVEEYLDLYVKFKLKVQKAKELRLDTIKALQQELAGYRQQLAKSYLVDKEVNQKLVNEALARKRKDIKVAHILVGLPERTNSTMISNAFDKAKQMKAKLDDGADFSLMAKTLSNDKATASNNGELGWISAMLPSGFYDFESAIYNTPKGETSGPIRSPLGVHIVKVLDTRPARGEVEVSHILIREKKKGKQIKNASAKADSLYQLISSGKLDFETMVAKHSDDANTAKKRGYLGYFGISQFELPFEDVAFSLAKDGDISKPVKTSIGWHIIKRISKKDYNNSEKLKAELQAQLEKNDRLENAKNDLIEGIKRNANYKDYPIEMNAFAQKLDASLYTYKWKIPELNDNAIFSIGNKKIKTKEFAEYLKKNTRTRLRFDKKKDIASAVKEMFTSFVNDKVIQYEEANLENRYPEFKSLMREYEEGILLFEATKINVWDKASKDTTGLKNFFERNKKNYTWNPRGVVDVYTLKSTDDQLIKQVKKLLKDKSAADLTKMLNTKSEIILHEEKTEEVGGKAFIGLEWKEGAISEAMKDTRNGYTSLKKLKTIIPATQKTLGDARGYIIADYQDELEAAWIKSLKKQYKVKTDKKVLKSIIK